MRIKMEFTVWSRSLSKTEAHEALNAAERMVRKAWHWEALSGIPQVKRVHSQPGMLDLVVTLPEGEGQFAFIGKCNHLLNRVPEWTLLNEEGLEVLDLEWYTIQ